jgi:Domain of unknown function (DUF5060)
MIKFLFCFLLAAPATLCAQELFETGHISSQTVQQWRTAEIGVRIPAADRRFRMFVAGEAGGKNPYSIYNMNLRAVFSCGNLRDTVQAFWFEQPVVNRAENRYDTQPSDWPWRIRFAPPAPGEWTMQLLTAAPAEPSAPVQTNIRLNCVKSDRHGWLKVAPDNRYLQFTDGTPFFAIGQNIAWADVPNLKGHAGPTPVYMGGYEDVYRYLNLLADCGGNFVRIVLTPWCGGLEGTTAGNYRQDHAAALDSMLHICEERGIYAQVNFEFHYGYNVPWLHEWKWEKHPLRSAANLNNYLELLSNDSAIKLQQQLIRYFHARFGNSPNLAVYELIGEMDSWKDFEERRDLFSTWISGSAEFIRNELSDRDHLITVSLATPPYGNIYDIKGVQLISIHHYTNNLTDNQWRYRIVNGSGVFGEKRGTLRRYNKPSQFGEMGMISGADPDDYSWCNDVSFHNALWATSFSGCFGTGLNWWQWKNDAYRINNFPPLAAFLKDVNMSALPETGMQDRNGLEVFWCADAAGTQAAGWLHNTSYWWGNMSNDCRDRHGKQMPLPRDNDKIDAPENRAGRIILIDNLKPNSDFSIRYFSTRTKDQVIKEISVKSNRLGKLKLELPGDIADCAFKVTLKNGVLITPSF